MSQIDDFFRSRLDQMIDLQKPLAVLATHIGSGLSGRGWGDSGIRRLLRMIARKGIRPFFVPYFFAWIMQQIQKLSQQGELPRGNSWSQIAGNLA